MYHVARWGLGIITDETHFYACSYATFIDKPAPTRFKKVRHWPNRTTGYFRLTRWLERLRQDNALLEGRRTPFRLVLLDTDHNAGILQHIAEEEPEIPVVDIITAREAQAMADDIRFVLKKDRDEVERIARLSLERHDYAAWAKRLGIIDYVGNAQPSR